MLTSAGRLGAWNAHPNHGIISQGSAWLCPSPQNILSAEPMTTVSEDKHSGTPTDSSGAKRFLSTEPIPAYDTGTEFAARARKTILWSVIISAVAAVPGIALVIGARGFFFQSLAISLLLVYGVWSVFWGFKVALPWWKNLERVRNGALKVKICDQLSEVFHVLYDPSNPCRLVWPIWRWILPICEALETRERTDISFPWQAGARPALCCGGVQYSACSWRS